VDLERFTGIQKNVNGFVPNVEPSMKQSKKKKSKYKKLVKLIEKWTRCEIMARLAPLTSKEACDYYQESLNFENKIRKKLFGSSDLVQLGEEWGMIKPKKIRKESILNKIPTTRESKREAKKAVKELNEFFS
jgi:hypothetical protein